MQPEELAKLLLTAVFTLYARIPFVQNMFSEDDAIEAARAGCYYQTGTKYQFS